MNLHTKNEMIINDDKILLKQDKGFLLVNIKKNSKHLIQTKHVQVANCGG